MKRRIEAEDIVFWNRTQACMDKYPDVLQMITACKVKDPGTFEDLRPMFQSLMLSQQPNVQKSIVALLKSCDVCEQSSMRHLMQAVANLLSPVLVINPNDKLEISFHGDLDSWYSIPGTFNGHPASLLISHSTVAQILSSRPRHFDDVGEKVVLNHINILRHLSHEHIITLYAFNTSHIPIFYVMEDSTHLQEYLRQRKGERTNCSDANLIKCLSQAAAALQYCHSRNIVLRNITTASFVVTGSDTLKLASFHLAFTLAENENERIIGLNLNESFMISMRWCAPESMRRHTWSKMSDIWMFGQWIYNLFTNVDMSNSENTLESDVPNNLQQNDPCIDKIAIKSIVSECVHLDPKQRATISNIINCLDLSSHRVAESGRDELKKCTSDETESKQDISDSRRPIVSPRKSAVRSSLITKTYNPETDATIKMYDKLDDDNFIRLGETNEFLSELRLIERALSAEMELNDNELEKMDLGNRSFHLSSTLALKIESRHLDMVLINPSDSESDYYSNDESDN